MTVCIYFFGSHSRLQLKGHMFVAQPGLGSMNLNRRSFEGELSAMTLWPEVEKVFGHGYEVSYQSFYIARF